MTLIDLLENLGGIVEVLFILVGVFVYPFSNYSYCLALTSDLYTVKSTQLPLLSKKTDSDPL